MGEFNKKVSIFVEDKRDIASKIALSLFLLIIVYFLYHGLITTPEQKQEIDSLTYHIPIAKYIAEGHIAKAPNLPHGLGYYPAVGEALLSLFIFFGLPLNLYNVLALIILFIVGYAIARRFKLAKGYSIIFALTITSLNTILRMALTQNIDIWLIIFFLLSIYFLQKPEKSYFYYLKIGVIFGLLIGIKYSGILYVAVLIFLYRKKLIRYLTLNRVIAIIAPVIIFGLFWYIRNYIYTNNPIYPVTMFGFLGSPTMRVIPVWASFSTMQGLKLNAQAFISEYLIWIFAPLIGLIMLLRNSVSKEVKTLIYLGFINIIIYFFHPSSFSSQIIITSNYRFTYAVMFPIILAIFIYTSKLRLEKKISVLSLLGSFSVLTQFSYRPKIIVFWIILVLVINNYKCLIRLFTKYE